MIYIGEPKARETLLAYWTSKRSSPAPYQRVGVGMTGRLTCGTPSP